APMEKTIGIAVVACFAANAPWGLVAAMIDTCRWTRSEAKTGNRSNCFERQILPFDKSHFAKTTFECHDLIAQCRARSRHHEADDRHCGLLRLRGEWTAYGTAANEDDELAPPHSITSSARTISDDGMVRPSVLAVLMLMSSSNFVGCSTGRSDGL